MNNGSSRCNWNKAAAVNGKYFLNLGTLAMLTRESGRQLARGAVAVLFVAIATPCLFAVSITFENPPYTPGAIIGQDGWVRPGYVGPGFDVNGSTDISTSAPLSGTQSFVYNQTTAAAGTGASDVVKPEVISASAGVAGVDLTVSYLLSAGGNGVNPNGVAGLYLSNNAVGGSSPLFARLEGASMAASDTNSVVTIPNFVYFAGDVLQVKYEVDFDAANYVLTVNNLTTNQLEFQQTLGFLAPFTPEGPNGEYLIDVGLLLRGGTAKFDDITLAAGVGPVISTLTWNVNKSGNWGVPQNWGPTTGVPGSAPGRQTAIFGNVITSPQTIYTNGDRSVNRLEFNSANSYTITGTGSISMQADTSGGTPVNPTIAVSLGSHQLQLKVNILDDTTVTVASGASLTFNNVIDLHGKKLTSTGTVNINNSIIGGGTVAGSGTVAALTDVDIDGNLVTDGTLLVSVGGSGGGAFNVTGDAVLAGILDVLPQPGLAPGQSFTIVSAGGRLDVHALALDSSDVGIFKLATRGGSLLLDYVGASVPEPASGTLFLAALAGIVLQRKRPTRLPRFTVAAIVGLIAAAAISGPAQATTFDFENPPFTTGPLVGQNGFVNPAYVLADPFFGGALNGTVVVSNSAPLSGAQSALYTQTSVPAGAGATGASDTGKRYAVFGTTHGNDGFDITSSFLINMNANGVGTGQAGAFLGQDGRSPALILLSGTQILVGTGFALPNMGTYVLGHTFEFTMGLDLDNSSYGVSYRDVTAGGTLTPIPGTLPNGQFPFFGGAISADGDGHTYTLDASMMLRSGTAQIDNFTVLGDDFVRANWIGNLSGDWNVNASWIPHMIPGTETPGKQIAVFGTTITSPQTIYTNSIVSVNGLEFNNTTTVVIGGSGTVELKANTASGTINPTINVLGGTHQLQAPVRIADDTTVTVAASASIDFNNTVNLNGKALSISGAGVTNLNVGVTGGGTITNSGSLGTAGTTPIAANLTSTGKLLFDLGPTNTDFFNITGSATLSGILDVTLESGFTPVGPYTLLTASGGLNAAGLTLDPSDTGTFHIGIVGNSIVLSLGGSGVNGDYNGNGVVDAADYVVWRNNVGTTNHLPNDAIGGTIGIAQYNLWRSRFGATSGSGNGAVAAAAVPEPAMLVISMPALAIGSVPRKKRGAAIQ